MQALELQLAAARTSASEPPDGSGGALRGQTGGASEEKTSVVQVHNSSDGIYTGYKATMHDSDSSDSDDDSDGDDPDV